MIKKVIVFDMDETLGHFYQMGTLWHILNEMSNKRLTKQDFFSMMDQFPGVIRPKIVETLYYLAQVKAEEKQNGSRNRTIVVLFTNSHSPKKWPTWIKEYLEMKIGAKVFDKVIATYKFNGKIVEPLRSSHMKSYSDLMRIINVSGQPSILFLDDQEHPLMTHEDVDIYPLEPYVKLYRLQYILDTIKKSPLMRRVSQNSVINDHNSLIFVLGHRLHINWNQMRNNYLHFYNLMTKAKGPATGKIHQKVRYFLNSN